MWLFLTVLACADGDTGIQGQPDPLDVGALVVEPTEITLTTGPDGGETHQFTAMATMLDGEEMQVDFAEWSVSNSSAGEVDGDGIFMPSIENGGITWVTAEYAGFESNATVTVVYEDEVVIDDADASLFGGSETAMESDPWSYPYDGVALPRNTHSIHFQWLDMGADTYRLSFTSPLSNITIYTTDYGWASAAEQWQNIAGTNADGQVSVELGAAVDGQVYVADPITINVNRMDARGTIYYWSSSVEGVKMIPYGGEAENYLSMLETNGFCIGCHAVSNGPDHLLAYTLKDSPADQGWPEMGYTEILTLDDQSEILTYESEQSSNLKAFSPDNTMMLGAADGTLLLWDAQTGEFLADVTPWNSDEDTFFKISQAEWSPDGNQIAVVIPKHMMIDANITCGRIALMDYLGGTSFGDPEFIIEPDDYFDDEIHSAYYPAFSPDGEWIAFNISTGNSYDDIDAELYVAPATGGEIIRLDNANLQENFSNSWPRWGPLPDDEVLWLTFSSRRDYGYTAIWGEPQIWVSAFDTDEAYAGEDPSSPAFWLPGQGIEENNHVPIWIE